jgi:hypothetical protein
MSRLLVMLILVGVLMSFRATKPCVQCNIEQYTEKGIKILNLEGGFTFLKSYPVDSQDGKKYSYIFSQGTQYMIALANNDAHSKGIYLSLYDSNNRMVATSFANGKFHSALVFTCKTTGIYQLRFNFENTKDFCAVGVLGMKR